MRPLLPLLAGTLALTAALASPGRAADPATRCQKATVTGLAACVQKVSKAQVACFEKTGYACLAGDQKLLIAFAELDKAIRGGQCPDAAAVEAAGYAPLESDELAERFQAACVREVGDISQRVFGGPRAPTSPAPATRIGSACSAPARRRASCWARRSWPSATASAGAATPAISTGPTRSSRSSRRRPPTSSRRSAAIWSASSASTRPRFARETSARTLDATASPCDPIDAGYCMFPFPNDYFSAGDLSSPTGRRLALSSRGDAGEQASRERPVRPRQVERPRRLQRRLGADRARRGARPRHVRRPADHRPRPRPSNRTRRSLLLDAATRRAAAPLDGARQRGRDAGGAGRSSRASARISRTGTATSRRCAT